MTALTDENMAAVADDMPKRRRRWIWPIAIITASLLLIQILFGTAPKSILYFVADRTASSILNERDAAPSLPFAIGQRLIAIWLEQNVIAQIYAAQKLSADTGDAERMGARLVKLRALLVSQSEIRHPAPKAPVEIAGLSWCDGLNGVGAILLSHEFDDAEVIGLKGKGLTPGDGHSFARVWSKQYKDWLYFDIWSDEVMVFRSRAGEKAQYLFRQIPEGNSKPSDDVYETLRWFHDRAYRAIPHNELQSTFGGYVWNRVWHYLHHGNTAPESYKLLNVAPASLAAGPADTSGQAVNVTTMPRTYVRARLDALFGNAAAARSAYARVAKSDSSLNGSYGKAAALFIRRMDVIAKP